MLTVVDELAGVAIGERGRAPAEPRSRFEHEHPRAVLRQPDGRTQAGKPRADDDHVELARHRHAFQIHCFNATAACRGRDNLTRPLNTS